MFLITFSMTLYVIFHTSLRGPSETPAKRPIYPLDEYCVVYPSFRCNFWQIELVSSYNCLKDQMQET